MQWGQAQSRFMALIRILTKQNKSMTLHHVNWKGKRQRRGRAEDYLKRLPLTITSFPPVLLKCNFFLPTGTNELKVEQREAISGNSSARYITPGSASVSCLSANIWIWAWQVMWDSWQKSSWSVAHSLCPFYEVIPQDSQLAPGVALSSPCFC